MTDTERGSVLLDEYAAPPGMSVRPVQPRPLAASLWLLSVSWSQLILAASGVFLAFTTLFALGYLLSGDALARAGSFRDAFFLSAQVFGRVNFGLPSPQGWPAQSLIVLELLAGWLFFLMFLAVAVARFIRLRVSAPLRLYAIERPPPSPPLPPPAADSGHLAN